MKFTFSLMPVQEQGSTYTVPQVSRYARTVQEAYQLALADIQAGGGVMCWYPEPLDSCTMCPGPFHPASGHWESETRHWCGPCARSVYKMLKEMLPRRWGKMRFYDLATAPTGDTSAQDLSGS